MSASLEFEGRHVIPRWRSVRRTVEAGEFEQLETARPLPAGFASYVDEAERRWSEEPNEISAAELVGGALVTGEVDRSADAAVYLTRIGETSLLRGLGERALDPSSTAGLVIALERATSESFEQHLRRLLHEDRLNISQDPRNPVAWARMARRYTMLGQLRKANRSLSVALALAPSSRYMHRIATRLYVHMAEPDRAYGLLRRFDRTQEDPWLLAAFLAVANLADLPTGGLRQARRLITEDDFRRIDVSELAGELGTMEMGAGQDRRARQLFELSLEQPTDNSLAQAEWASDRLPQLRVGLEDIRVPFADEAHALSATKEGEWEASLAYCGQWLDDQPFDAGAAIHGSYVSSVALEKWDESIAFGRAGLRSSPRHPLLSNNLAFALIEDDQLEEASRVLASADWGAASDYDRTALMATQGLLALRSGDLAGGRRLYEGAISRARNAKNDQQEAMAEAMLLQETIRHHVYGDGDWVTSAIAALRELKNGITDKAVLLCISRTESLLNE
jgi:Tfp pilus assembly protein PilF